MIKVLKQVATSIFLVSLVLSFIPLKIGHFGAYNTFSRLAICDDSACLHEEGHAIDQDMNWESKDPSYEMAIYSLCVSNTRLNVDSERTIKLFTILSGDYGFGANRSAEVYANVYQLYGGYDGLPASLKPFYGKRITHKLLMFVYFTKG